VDYDKFSETIDFTAVTIPLPNFEGRGGHLKLILKFFENIYLNFNLKSKKKIEIKL
jgi:hypothetical protein